MYVKVCWWELFGSLVIMPTNISLSSVMLVKCMFVKLCFGEYVWNHRLVFSQTFRKFITNILFTNITESFSPTWKQALQCLQVATRLENNSHCASRSFRVWCSETRHSYFRKVQGSNSANLSREQMSVSRKLRRTKHATGPMLVDESKKYVLKLELQSEMRQR